MNTSFYNLHILLIIITGEGHAEHKSVHDRRSQTAGKGFEREKSQLHGEGRTEQRAKLHSGWYTMSGLGWGGNGRNLGSGNMPQEATGDARESLCHSRSRGRF